jgi:O-antigen biosynthesis protein WbqP
MIRFFDIVLSCFGLVMCLPILVCAVAIGSVAIGSPIFRQTRVGRHQKPFTIVKLRSMPIDTASMASHLVDAAAITPYGRFLRRTKIDELPQLWNVLCGDMSMVGPRPCLFNQEELIAERAALGVFDFRPGITGLAQVSNIDMSTPTKLAKVDHEMLAQLTLRSYFLYILLTAFGKGVGDRVSGIDS